MKILTNFLTSLLIISSMVSVAGCGSKDEEELDSQDTLNESEFVGYWEAIENTHVYYLVLKSNGIGRQITQYNQTKDLEEKSIIWYYKNKTFSILTSAGIENYIVSKLTNNLMILKTEDNITLSFSRVSSSAIPGDSSEPNDPDTPDTPDTPDNPGPSGNYDIKTGSAEPRAFSAKISGVYNGSKLPSVVGFEYSYDNSFPQSQTSGYAIDGRFGGFEFQAEHLVDLAKVYYRVYAVIDGNKIYGETKSFETLQGTYTIDGKTYNFIKVTGLATGSFSMMQTELPPTAELIIEGKSLGCLSGNYSSTNVTAGATREFLNRFAETIVVPRYPTPQEWQFASAGGTKSKGYKYSGSNDINMVAWYSENSNNHVRKPAQKEPNELGFYDMSGNYSEYCGNYDEDQLEDIRELYIKGFVSTLKDVKAIYFDTSWKAKGGAFGGYWGSKASDCQTTSSEMDNTPANTNHYNGDIYSVRLVYSRPD